MVYQIKRINCPKIDRVYNKSMRELDSFFNLNWKYNQPDLILVPDRKTIDSLRRRKTEDWVVGWADGSNVYLLSDKNYERESNHKYSNEEYYALIKHELAHCFSNTISNFSQKPRWLLEGISIFLSDQNKLRNKPKEFKKFIDFYGTNGKEVYYESGFAVEFLVKIYGKRKLILLLKKLKESNSKEDFAKLFKSIYGFDLSYQNFKII